MRQVVVTPYDELWPEAFALESARLTSSICNQQISIHHIGSTAIPGLSAKPIIDMLAVVDCIKSLDQQERHWQAIGYEAMGEFGISGRRYFRKNESAWRRTHQVHAFQLGSPQIDRHLAFRDFMIAHPVYAKEYESLKLQLAESYPNDIAGYCNGKDAFIRQIDVIAAQWRASTNDRRK
ncbi:MAG: hypothetical protein JWM11_2768 [Planctomycetaceae bacterium]|nr:hypothetical protein [Planctomycetaceae bacterium]